MAHLVGGIAMDAEVRELCLAILRLVRDEPASASFRQPLSRKKAPHYFNVIQQPMDLATLEHKLVVDGEFATLEEFANGLRLIWRNAFCFNEKGDRHNRAAFESAAQLALLAESHIEQAYCARLEAAGERVPAMQRLQIELFHLRNNSLALWFREPVSPESCPDYREQVAEPMDLRTALSNIDLGHWTKPQQVEAGVHLIWTNARAYNGEGSAIDAAAICCSNIWSARYSRVVNSAARQRKLRRVPTPGTLVEEMRLVLLEMCRRVPPEVLRQIGDALRAHAVHIEGEGQAQLAVDLSAVHEAHELALAIQIARGFLEPQVRTASAS